MDNIELVEFSAHDTPVHFAFRFRISHLLPPKSILLGNTCQGTNPYPDLISWRVVIRPRAINPTAKFSCVRYHQRRALIAGKAVCSGRTLAQSTVYLCSYLLKFSINCFTWTTPSNPARSPLGICAFSASGSPSEETITSPALTSSFWVWLFVVTRVLGSAAFGAATPFLESSTTKTSSGFN